MKLYRNINWTELFEVSLKGTVTPKLHPGSEDSTIPAGEWSFWFDQPIHFEGTAAMVEVDTVPDTVGSMTIRWEEPDMEGYTNDIVGEVIEYGLNTEIEANIVGVRNYFFHNYVGSTPRNHVEQMTWEKNRKEHENDRDRIRRDFLNFLTDEQWDTFCSWMKSFPNLTEMRYGNNHKVKLIDVRKAAKVVAVNLD